MEEIPQKNNQRKYFSIPTIIALVLIILGILMVIGPYVLRFKLTGYTNIGGIVMVLLGMVFGIFNIIEAKGKPNESSIFAKFLLFFGGSFIIFILGIAIIGILILLYFTGAIR